MHEILGIIPKTLIIMQVKSECFKNAMYLIFIHIIYRERGGSWQ